MSGGRLSQMHALLRPLRLYDLGSGGLVDAELAAYAAAFSLVEELLEDILLQAFVQTADGDALGRYERLVGLWEHAGVPLENRRELVLQRMALAPFDFNHAGMQRSAIAAGLEADIAEHMAEEAILVTGLRLVDPSLDLGRVQARLAGMLPAHLDIRFDIGTMTWDMFDALSPDWDDWDSLDFSWNRFDLDGHNIFEGGDGDAEQQ